MQVNRIAIAEAFFQLFEDENEDSNYWLFSNFIKKLESLLVMKEEMVCVVAYFGTQTKNAYWFCLFCPTSRFKVMTQFWRILTVNWQSISRTWVGWKMTQFQY